MNNHYSWPSVWLVIDRPKTSQLANNPFVFILTATTVADSIISNFTFTALKPIVNRTTDTTLQSIQINHTDLNRNTVSAFTPLGSGLHYHLSLKITAAQYTSTTISTADFFVPENS